MFGPMFLYIIPGGSARFSMPSSMGSLVFVLVVPIVFDVKDQCEDVEHLAGHWVVLHPGGQLDKELAHE